MTRPHYITLSLLLYLLATGASAADDDWYQVELLIVEQPARAPGAGDEAWPPFPDLGYPREGRFLIDPLRLQERLQDYPLALASEVDDRGRQVLRLPSPRGRLQPASDYPEAPDIPRETPAAAESSGRTAAPGPASSGEPPDPAGAPGGSPGNRPAELGVPPGSSAPGDAEAAGEEDFRPPTAFAQLSASEHEFRGKAAYMARQGNYRILFHERWWQPVPGPDRAVPIVLDHSGDGGAWPRLQGSVTLSRSRYLHLTTRLWLNTDGQGLPDTWRMPAPPRGPDSLVLENVNARPLTWLLAPGVLPERSDRRLFPQPSDAADPPEWPWRHAVTLEQQRRMRSGEVHYLDHPRLGVIIKLIPLDQETLEAADYDQAWRHLVTGSPPAEIPGPTPEPGTTAPTTGP